MADALRNEISIELAGETRTMRASFSAIRSIESALGRSIVAVINQIGQQGDLSVTGAATIVHFGLRGYQDTRLTIEQVGDAIMEVGLAKVSVPIVEFVSLALSGVSVGKSAEAAK